MEIFKFILVAVLAYCIGNLHNAFIVGKLIKKLDIREHGSGNCGATNAFRVLGAKLGLVVFIGDVLKAIIAVLIGRLILQDQGVLVAGLFVIIGHDFPVFLKFKGGKGIASTFGVMLMINPIIALIALTVFVIITVTTQYVTLASIVSITLAPIGLFIVSAPMEFSLLGLFLCILAIFQHRANIKRLLNGTESKIYKKKG